MSKTIAKNRKAYFDYEIVEEFEAGIILRGYEVKSARLGRVNLKGAYIGILSDGPYVMDMHIGAYENANIVGYDPRVKRKILLHTKEIDRLRRAESQSGFTVIPLKIYLKKGLIKLKIGIVKGKKKQDKRETIKRREADREARRAMKKFKY